MKESKPITARRIDGAVEITRDDRLAWKVPTTLTTRDCLGSLKARLGFGRMDYAVAPGLYAVGEPTGDSPVLVTANYKLTFDTLRSQLSGLDAWIVVLETHGVNVWCAAGKGTFGTQELVGRIRLLQLGKLVNHRLLILPQLGAVGVAAHEVKAATGFTVIYGPVRASDIRAFIAADCKAEPHMRQVRFTLADRAVLTPIELRLSLKYLLVAVVLVVALSGLGTGGYSRQLVETRGLRSAVLLVCAWVAGAVIGPLLLPWLPGRAFSLKGAWVGMALATVICFQAMAAEPVEALAWLCITPAAASFLTMNFTGASTYTSLSGVRAEMRIAVPMQAVAAGAGITLFIIAGFMK